MSKIQKTAHDNPVTPVLSVHVNGTAGINTVFLLKWKVFEGFKTDREVRISK
jgi:hypothetical protein